MAPSVRTLSLLLLFGCLAAASGLAAQAYVAGRAPSAYRGKVVHLDLLEAWDDFRLIADHQQLAQVAVDDHGRFAFNGLSLPPERMFYRVRFRDPALCPAVCMDFTERHYVTFLAAAGDTVLIDRLGVSKAVGDNAALGAIAGRLDEHHDRLRQATTERMGDLIRHATRRYLAERVRLGTIAEALFALGHWPGGEVPVVELVALSERVPASTLSPQYGRSLRRATAAYRNRRQRGEVILWRGIAAGAFALGLLLGWRWRSKKEAGAARRCQEKTQSGVGPDRKPSPRPTPCLSPKEKEVLAAILRGKSNREIARQLFVAEATVKSHVNSIYRKTEAPNRETLILRGKQGLYNGAEAKSTGE